MFRIFQIFLGVFVSINLNHSMWNGTKLKKKASNTDSSIAIIDSKYYSILISLVDTSNMWFCFLAKKP